MSRWRPLVESSAGSPYRSLPDADKRLRSFQNLRLGNSILAKIGAFCITGKDPLINLFTNHCNPIKPSRNHCNTLGPHRNQFQRVLITMETPAQLPSREFKTPPLLSHAEGELDSHPCCSLLHIRLPCLLLVSGSPCFFLLSGSICVFSCFGQKRRESTHILGIDIWFFQPVPARQSQPRVQSRFGSGQREGGRPSFLISFTIPKRPGE